LTPINLDAADQGHSKLEELGIDEQDITDAVAWARR
jgi:hypothetical protein